MKQDVEAHREKERERERERETEALLKNKKREIRERQIKWKR